LMMMYMYVLNERTCQRHSHQTGRRVGGKFAIDYMYARAFLSSCRGPRRFQNFASRVSRLKCQSPLPPLHWCMPMSLQSPTLLT
jgi:hypothetical protein